MSNNLALRIESPCEERWESMHPQGRGRFCDSCRKTVVDFTVMSDQAILSWISKPNRSVCGRFHPDQLNRTLLRPPARKGSWAAFWQLLLAGLLVTGESSAQTASSSQGTIQVPQARKTPLFQADIPFLTASSDTLRGRIVDSAHNYPLAGATIQFGRHAVAADAEGRFHISRKDALAAGELKVSYIGYTTQTIRVDNNWPLSDEKIISFSGQPELMGTLGMVVVAERSPRKKRQASLPVIIKDTLATVGWAKKALTVYPNPIARGASLNLALRLDRPGPWSVQLFNSTGMVVQTLQVDGSDESKRLSMNIPFSLGAGIYFVRLSHPALQKVYTQEILVN